MKTTRYSKPKTLITIVGPTAIGKTALAIQIAQQLNTEIISADSRQFFKELSIGTAKPSPAELAAVPHHFIDSHSVQTFFSTGDFEVEALQVIDQLFKKHDTLICVGGSGLYIDALIKGLDELPEIDLSIREQLNHKLETEGILSIQKQLADLDPEYYQRVDQSNPQRMIRGLEMILSTGIKLSSLLTNQVKERPFNIIKIGLNTDRALLYERINARVDQMMELGLLNEVKSLIQLRHLNALQTVGYAELFAYLDGECTLAEAVDKIKQNTRRFAKRQITWFKRDPQTTWFDPKNEKEILDFIFASLSNFIKPE
ncbi:MAG: tRNA (adenosine(37)-N6)-dimethylallyltransferase MiaA [Pedobacter sp.]|nr:MAG: tRNA (adenosine(37)-N6)-dimethylallyltransferase MiaA [Pedobacter sp.]